MSDIIYMKDYLDERRRQALWQAANRVGVDSVVLYREIGKRRFDELLFAKSETKSKHEWMTQLGYLRAWLKQKGFLIKGTTIDVFWVGDFLVIKNGELLLCCTFGVITGIKRLRIAAQLAEEAEQIYGAPLAA